MELTHLDAAGSARMVDVSAKEVTARQATAIGSFRTTEQVVVLLLGGCLPKGDALAVARIAGIAAAKRTSDLLPLCHPVAVHGVTVDLNVESSSVAITATVRTADRTGVEMEALTCVAAAGLALYDMVKAIDRAAVLTDIRLLHKSGGRRGDWHADFSEGERSGAAPADLPSTDLPFDPPFAAPADPPFAAPVTGL